MTLKHTPPDNARLDRLVAEARRQSEARAQTYREQALKLLPRVCARCGRSFDGANLHQLTVHHKDHDHHHNPADGSNWELLCIYCHDAEHSRELDAEWIAGTSAGKEPSEAATHNPFAGLSELLKKDNR